MKKQPTEARQSRAELFTDLDRTSSTWGKLVACYEARLQDLRRQNDAPKEEMRTAVIRGRIAEIKEFLALGNPVAEYESDDLDY